MLSSSSSAVIVFYSSEFCYHRLSLLPSCNTASFLCCQRFQMLSSFSSAVIVFYSVTSATIVSHCSHHVTLLRVTFLLPTFPTAVIVF
ncbi:hypothetical protein CDAR_510041 [Caerostris darwini]|uniref:Uncharacterized protein n=1 Tax=Caerostris darwini TaxID=1538125 RepID=A0AAV4X1C7_9ARAC|nr:hypothetical protein CDAR_510041 [Caerostris darwini]